MDWAKLWPEITLIVGGATDAFHGQISAFITAHPTIAMILALVYGVLAKFQQSPIKPS